MCKGKVKWFDPEGGYGYITSEDGLEVMVRRNEIRTNGFQSLSDGQRVLFDLVEGPLGMQASNVTAYDNT